MGDTMVKIEIPLLCALRTRRLEGERMTEQQAIELLSSYRQKQARLQVLSSYSVGAGITISRLNEDDHLQELHRKLRGLPSYLYLSAKEQRLEATAHAYLERYPAGTRAQLAAVPREGADEEDGPPAKVTGGALLRSRGRAGQRKRATPRGRGAGASGGGLRLREARRGR